jgi:hypothetical protein
MADIFLSYVQEDGDVAREVADGLEKAGYAVWYYERDSLPGHSYLEQILGVLDDARAVVVIISPATLGSPQVNIEISEAHTANKPFVPLLRDLSYATLTSRRRPWTMMFGTAVATPIPEGGIAALMPRLVRGLKALGVAPGDDGAAAQSPVDRSTPLIAPAPHTTKRADAKPADMPRESRAPLDIARVVPFPADLGEFLLGRAGYFGKFYTLAELAARRAGEATEADAEAMLRTMIAAGWRQRYENFFVLRNPDEPRSKIFTIDSSVDEFGSAENASDMFARRVADFPGVEFPTVGDESVLRLRSGEEGKAAWRNLNFRVGSLVVRINVFNYLNTYPDLALLESVARKVVARATVVAERGVTPLGAMALRLDFAAADWQNNRYAYCAGIAVEQYAGKDTNRENRIAAYARLTEVFGLSDVFALTARGAIASGEHQSAGAEPGRGPAAATTPTPVIAGGDQAAEFVSAAHDSSSGDVTDEPGAPDATQVTMEGALYAFPNESAAGAFVSDARRNIVGGWSPRGQSFTEVPDVPSLGVDAVAFATRKSIGSGEETGGGFRFYGRHGAIVAQMEIVSRPDMTLTNMARLMELQLACIAANGCTGVATLSGQFVGGENS